MARVTSMNINRSALEQVGMEAASVLVTDVTRRTLNRASVLAPVDTGRLRVSGDMRVSRGAGQVVGTVSFDADYALAVHEGTRPHIIRPRNARALRFRVGGEIVYAKSVRHPGTRARPFLFEALSEIAGREGFVVTRL